MNDEITLADVREGLILRPGDHLVLLLKDNHPLETVADFKQRLQDQLGDVEVTVVADVEQIAKISAASA